MATRAPAGLEKRGRGFWRKVLDRYELTDAELQQLAEICRVLDRLDHLAEVIADQGVTSVGSTGQQVVHPALAESRQQQLALVKMLGHLELPTEDEADTALPSPVSMKAAKAARSRWRVS